MDQGGDSDSSDWDSTLDFTSPRPSGPPQPFPRIEVEDDVSQMDSVADKPKQQATDKKNPASSMYMDVDDDHSTHSALYATPQKRTTPKPSPQMQRAAGQQGSDVDEPPPYNFRSAINGSMTPTPTPAQRPGKDRKEDLYDVVAPSPGPQRQTRQDSLQSTGSWDDSDPDERTLRELRQNFSKEKQKEQAAEDLKLKLQRDADNSRADDPMPTNRSDVSTWKSLMGKKNNNNGATSSRSRGKTRKETARPVSAAEVRATVGRETPRRSARAEVMADQQQQIRVQQQLNTQLQQQQQFNELNVQGAVVPKNEDAVKAEPGNKDTYTDVPAYIDPPYIVKDEDGRYVYYFGHGSLQYYEVDDEASEAFMPRMADKVDVILKRVFQEFFGLLRIIIGIVIMLVVELFKFLIKYILNPLFVGIFETFGDYVFKPFLSILFNGFIQPLGVFLWNCFVALRHMFGPIGDILKKVFIQLAYLCRSIRLIEIHWKTGNNTNRPIDYNPNDLSTV